MKEWTGMENEVLKSIKNRRSTRKYKEAQGSIKKNKSVKKNYKHY